MKRIAIYIRAKEISPSGYYRILQYTRNLDAKFYIHNILSPQYYKFYLKYKNKLFYKWLLNPITFFLMYIRICYFLFIDNKRQVDKVIISRALLPKYFLFPIGLLCLRLLKKTEFIWDFDDDILCSGEISKKEFNFLSEKSKIIIVTHEYLAKKISKCYSYKIICLPTTDGDFRNTHKKEYRESRRIKFENELHLVWIGSAVNLLNLRAAIPALEKAATHYQQKFGKQVVLNICSSMPLNFATEFLSIKNVKWDRYVAVDVVAKSHIGIMPLLPLEYALGKGGFKLIQYMAAGLPVIGSCVGYNKEIIDNTMGRLVEHINSDIEWEMAIETLSKNWESYLDCARCSLDKWKKKYSYEKNLETWKTILEI